MIQTPKSDKIKKFTISKRWLIVIFLVFCIGCGLFIPLTEFWGSSRPPPVLMWNGQPFYPVGVNYYPSSHPWEGTWTSYNHTELAADLDTIHTLGGNCIRTFLQWELVEPVCGVFNQTIVNNVVDFFNTCSASHIAVIFSFFDYGPPAWAGVAQDQMYVNQSLIAREDAQLQYIIPLINQTSAAFIWDLKNEPTSNTVTIQQV